MQLIHLDVGASLVLDIDRTFSKVKCEFIGMNPYQYLIIKITNGDVYNKINKYLSPGASITIRCLQNGIVYGFVSKILSVLQIPDKLVFISYPKSIVEKTVRKQARVKCNLPANVILDEEEFCGIVVDISRKGCLFTFSRSNGALCTDDMIFRCTLLSEQIKLLLKVPGASNALNILCARRNIRPDDVSIGMEFKQMSDEDSILLNEYLIKVDALPRYFNFSLAINKHTIWMKRLYDFLDGNENISILELTSPHACRLGQWLHSDGMATYSYLSEMSELESIHNQLHHLANDVVTRNKSAALSRRDKDFFMQQIEQLSSKIIALLANLEKQVAPRIATDRAE